MPYGSLIRDTESEFVIAGLDVGVAVGKIVGVLVAPGMGVGVLVGVGALVAPGAGVGVATGVGVAAGCSGGLVGAGPGLSVSFSHGASTRKLAVSVEQAEALQAVAEMDFVP